MVFSSMPSYNLNSISSEHICVDRGVVRVDHRSSAAELMVRERYVKKDLYHSCKCRLTRSNLQSDFCLCKCFVAKDFLICRA